MSNYFGVIDWKESPLDRAFSSTQQLPSSPNKKSLSPADQSKMLAALVPKRFEAKIHPTHQHTLIKPTPTRLISTNSYPFEQISDLMPPKASPDSNTYRGYSPFTTSFCPVYSSPK